MREKDERRKKEKKGNLKNPRKTTDEEICPKDCSTNVVIKIRDKKGGRAGGKRFFLYKSVQRRRTGARVRRHVPPWHAGTHRTPGVDALHNADASDGGAVAAGWITTL